ncbi:MAG: sigma 54-interacting transcriptional regulator [Peptococcaceae bacterium]|nr:sigma 54-interacting transcriptional regulator [Peptococcaceae bacterium]
MSGMEMKLKSALEELNQVKKRLRELEAVFEHCHDGISIVDRSGKIVSSNPAMQKLYNLSAGDYVGKNVNDLVKEGIFNTNVSARVLATGQPLAIMQEVRTGVRCLTTGVPVMGEDGRVEMVVVTSHDVTELYALKERLRQSQKLAGGYQAELTDMRIAQMQKEDIVVRSRKMLDILDLARRLAAVDTTVLITGESGSGKEVVATLLHRASPRRSEKSFIKVNCGAIPRDLLESELFGYEYGAFTGAAREGRPGLFELADGGSIFLDEVGELPLDLQVKLLRVLQEKEFKRIGSTREVRVDVRVIAASNRDLQELVSQGRFREDLYYRLNVVPLKVPPLRERKEDIVALAQHYVRHFNRRYGFEKVLSAELIDVMENYHWPGNVRELVNVVERMVVTGKGNILGAEEFPLEIPAPEARQADGKHLPKGLGIQEVLRETEKSVILNVLQNSRSTAGAAKSLGISRATLARKMRKYGIRRR